MTVLIKGHWIKRMEVIETETFRVYEPKWYCSECGDKYDACVAKQLKICPNCGTMMDKKETE